MKVLITGASGRLAGYVVRELADSHKIVLTSRREPPAELAGFPWIQGDLNRFEDCQRAVQSVEAIQHLGAQPWPVDHPGMRKRAEEQGIPFDATFKTNMLGTYYLMQAAVEAGVRIVVMAGSNCALGHGFRISNTPFPIQALPITETHPCYPEDSYSYSKRAGEDLLARVNIFDIVLVGTHLGERTLPAAPSARIVRNADESLNLRTYPSCYQRPRSVAR